MQTSAEKIFELLRPILAEQRNLDPDRISITSYIERDLDLDSMDFVEIILEIENTFDLHFDESQDELLTAELTVGQLVLEIKNKLETCPYCQQLVAHLEGALRVNNYSQQRWVYVHPECETPDRQLERVRIQEERIRREEQRIQQQREWEQQQRESRLEERGRNVAGWVESASFALASVFLSVILVYVLGLKVGILILFLASFLGGLFFLTEPNRRP